MVREVSTDSFVSCRKHIIDQSQVITSVIHLTPFICRANSFLDEMTEKKNNFIYRGADKSLAGSD